MKIGFCGLLTIVFIVLKLTNVIYWSWLWVLAPMWIPLAIAGVFFGIAIILSGLAQVWESIANRSKND